MNTSSLILHSASNNTKRQSSMSANRRWSV